MKQEPFPYIDRDISWLSFNYRVLQEAKDPNVPLLERIKFLAIYSSNLDEFFRVRVANHKNLVRLGKKTRKKLGLDSKLILSQLLQIVNDQQLEFSRIFEEEVIPALHKEGINILKQKKMSKEQKQFSHSFFDDKLLPYIQPMLLMDEKIKPFLRNGALYLALDMRSKDSSDENAYYAIIKIPSEEAGRFLILPSKKHNHDLILIDDVVRDNIDKIFPGFDIIGSYSIKLTRDAELYIDDEFSGNLILKIKTSLEKRNVGPASRLIYDRDMPAELLHYLKDVFELKESDLVAEGRYHNNSDFFTFPDFGMKHLKDIPMDPIGYTPLEKCPDFFEAIEAGDHLLYFPFHSYESVIRFFEDAAQDQKVTHIKLFQYRVAKVSRIMEALKLAVKNGKQVTAFIEVKARFDEEANLSWGETLEESGVNVIYSMPGLKVHSKIALIRRVVDSKERFYAYLSTGNFHETTAKLYCDFGLFTTNKQLLREELLIFSYVENKIRPEEQFENLGVGTFNLKPKLIELIEREIKMAEEGKEARIFLKMNSIQDQEMIDLLYRASQVGVKIRMIIRGICSLVPGIEGISENIEASSILDRFLEHARVFIFHNGGQEEIYMSSADWMVRNLHYRIETMFPIKDPKLKYLVKVIMRIQSNDNVKARYLDFRKNNEYRRDVGIPVRSQYDTYYFIKRQEENR